jgi:hypothetical protein
MNLIYHKFFELEVIHSYLPEGISNDFRLMPSSDTQSELQSYNIILRQQHNLFSFYCGSSNADSFDPAAELAALNTLQFQLLNIDFIFKYYTEETDISNNNILYLKNRPNSEELQMEWAPASNQYKPNCVAVIFLDMQTIVDENKPVKKLKHVFNVRKVFWEYQIVIPDYMKFNEKDLKIVGIQNETYKGPVKKSIGNKNAFVMISGIPLALKRSLDRYPLLELYYTDIRSNKSNTLEFQLPNQDPQSIRTKLVDGSNMMFLSSTIIYL